MMAIIEYLMLGGLIALVVLFVLAWVEADPDA
jgi:hypothetical protein